MAARTSCLVVAIIAVTATSLHAQNFSTIGTRRGGLAGAVIGGIIGNQNNETGAGIAIGALVGGAAGRIYGNRLDYRQQQAYYNSQQLAYAQRRAAAAQSYRYPSSYGRRVYYPSGSVAYSRPQQVYRQPQRYYYRQ